MIHRFVLSFFSFFLLFFSSAGAQNIRVGAERMEVLLPLLEGKRVGIVSNTTGVVGPSKTLLADTLLSRGIQVVTLFSPEHGYRANADAGASVQSGQDEPTGLPVISLYGKNRKPTQDQLEGVDLLLFDLQDVGTRFYTYISTMHYIMEAAAEMGLEVVVCDRPNPNDFVDGPVLQSGYRSFVGMHPIPVLHGLTVGELAIMINEERWLSEGKQCVLFVVPIDGWRHGDYYAPPVPPSPNLKDYIAIRRYPSLCFFEATVLSVGRGTDKPFRVIGYPHPNMGQYTFLPEALPGASNPKHKGKECYGIDYSAENWLEGLCLKPLIDAQAVCREMGVTMIDRKRSFDLLAGNNRLRQQIEEGWTEEEIRQTWQADLNKYRTLRHKYLIYPE